MTVKKLTKEDIIPLYDVDSDDHDSVYYEGKSIAFAHFYEGKINLTGFIDNGDLEYMKYENKWDNCIFFAVDSRRQLEEYLEEEFNYINY